MSQIARHALVKGRVQGVAFRWRARERAAELGVTGWIRNLPDGRVEAWIEGMEAPVEAMLAWLETGPPHARVEAVDAAPREAEGWDGFEVRTGP